jgi:hypothetical protein
MNTENLSTLKIHKLTQAQYDRELAAGRIDNNAIYLTPEEEIDFPVDSVNGKTGAVTLSASDVGAAASSHNHSASNITSGTLSADRLPAATSSSLGGVKVGSNITNSSGTISLSKTNVTNALGYTPAQSSHNHSAGNITSGTLDAARLPAATSSALGGVKVGSNITNSSGTISLTKANVTSALGYTPPTTDTNTTYSAGTGISLSGTTFSNSGVRSIATGSSNGTISVNTNGTATNVAVKGLGTAAYTASTAYAASSHNHSASNITSGTLPIKRGGTGCSSAKDVLQSLGLAAMTATGTASTLAMSANTVTKIPLTTCVGGSGAAAYFSFQDNGSVELDGEGVYLICGSVYIKSTAKSGGGQSQAGCYIKKTYDGDETEILSASIDFNSATSRDVCVSTGMKVVALENGAQLTLHARTNNGVAATAYPSNVGTFLTIIRLGYTVSTAI